ncbi:DUF1351 domain-containing protein [Oenococcus oeni]|uniref:Prophage protein n=1 Tax=Oenococcus phage phiS11 TaxID=1432847 RepID=V5UTB6_9CAUD|nr:DUF1351 domain-containing protein [Oenococcus oeni]YP_009006550.1 DUF1351 domain-containing protein [Oenococcus phage phiS11]AHB80309.1 prophage protein [Oenococcus phage phiS11]KGH52483.1 hypothetical protein X325_06500 [Oenococcus oeni S11]MDS0175989.1 DUF1351 domain-containing protein [Oenococcus oeni]OIK56557.1 hypothetical protein ATW61_06840 [Oenococcus oeni]OIM37097.1 hypothetical protein ATX68_12760 [Oenococcus oeni]
MTEMELSATIEPILDYKAASIQLKNADILKDYVKKQIDRYRDLLITDETLTEAKKSRADLNKLNKALSSQRTAIKKEILKPFAQIESVLRKLETDTKQASGSIDQGVKQLEDRQRQAREDNLKAYLAELIVKYPYLQTIEIKIPEDWTNKSNFTKSMGLSVGLTRMIADTLGSLEKQKETRASNLETVRSYAEVKDVNPDPYLRMLTEMDYQPAEIFRAIDLDIENAREKAAQEEIDLQLRQSQESAHKKVVNDLLIDTDTGETIKRVEKMSYWYYGLVLSKDKKDLLDNFLIAKQIKIFGSKEKSQI